MPPWKWGLFCVEFWRGVEDDADKWAFEGNTKGCRSSLGL